ncbi:hypothetical protein EG329_012350 [Mollisiaceae sp. DMI_Dod_QoI]|nr:hypothetical protein EG329_012350 [Helotiales sp. DMI_Dod_QoI]
MNNGCLLTNGEIPSSGPAQHPALTLNPQTGRQIGSINSTETTTTTETVMDTPMDDGSKTEDIPPASDYEYDSHDEDEDEDSDIDYDERISEQGACDGQPINTPIGMGEAIAFCFPNGLDFYLGEDGHMFDDGLDGDETDDSEATTNYEELTEPDIVLTVVEVSEEEDVKMVGEDSGSEETDDDSYATSADSEELNVDDNNVDKGLSPMQVDPPTTKATPALAPSAAPTLSSLSQLLKIDLEAKELEKTRDADLWKLLGLQEALRAIERQIPEVEADLRASEAAVISNETKKVANIISCGLSSELYEAYSDFCASLHPEFGLREGFSITCHEPHNCSYFTYDPEFEGYADQATLNVVEFWPVRSPEPQTGFESTWGEQYPLLYRLAIEAAQRRSAPAKEMLMKLPSRDASLSGWLFEYKFEELLKDEPIVSRRWVFNEARCIDDPSTLEKTKYIERLLTA